MANLKFDEFFYEGEIVNLRNALDENLKDLQPDYDRDKLYCPECHIAQLKFTRRTNSRSAFLSTKQPSLYNPNNHHEDCSFILDTASKRQVREYYRELTNEQIEDKLDAAINLYLRSNNEVNNREQLPHRNQNPGILTAIENGHQVHRRLPKRSIYSIYNITDDELDIPLLFYGQVRLEATEHPSKFDTDAIYYKLHIISNKTGNVIRRFNIKRVPLPISSGSEYFLTMIVIASRNDSKTIYYELYRKNPLSLKYIPAR